MRINSHREQASTATKPPQYVWVVSEMASSRGAIGQEIKQHFATKEGCYRLLDLSVYSRPTKIPYSVQQCHPVRVSFVTVKDQGGCNDRIAFNVGRELYFYIYKGVRKVSEILQHSEKKRSWNKFTDMATHICVNVFPLCMFSFCTCRFRFVLVQFSLI